MSNTRRKANAAFSPIGCRRIPAVSDARAGPPPHDGTWIPARFSKRFVVIRDDLMHVRRKFCAVSAAAALMFSASPASAVTALGHFNGPVISWLARAPASCAFAHLREVDGYRDYRDNDHAAYWVGNAMSNDDKQFDNRHNAGGKAGAPPAGWSGMPDPAESIGAVYDRNLSLALFTIGHTDMFVRGIFADQPAPPAGAPKMDEDLSGYSLAGHVRPGDSLATVTHALGLHALTPTPLASCPGLSVVEICGWNAKDCVCGHSFEEWLKAGGGNSGTIVFRNARVTALIWDAKCFPGG